MAYKILSVANIMNLDSTYIDEEYLKNAFNSNIKYLPTYEKLKASEQYLNGSGTFKISNTYKNNQLIRLSDVEFIPSLMNINKLTIQFIHDMPDMDNVSYPLSYDDVYVTYDGRSGGISFEYHPYDDPEQLFVYEDPIKEYTIEFNDINDKFNINDIIIYCKDDENTAPFSIYLIQKNISSGSEEIIRTANSAVVEQEYMLNTQGEQIYPDKNVVVNDDYEYILKIVYDNGKLSDSPFLVRYKLNVALKNNESLFQEALMPPMYIYINPLQYHWKYSGVAPEDYNCYGPSVQMTTYYGYNQRPSVINDIQNGARAYNTLLYGNSAIAGFQVKESSRKNGDTDKFIGEFDIWVKESEIHKFKKTAFDNETKTNIYRLSFIIPGYVFKDPIIKYGLCDNYVYNIGVSLTGNYTKIDIDATNFIDFLRPSVRGGTSGYEMVGANKVDENYVNFPGNDFIYLTIDASLLKTEDPMTITSKYTSVDLSYIGINQRQFIINNDYDLIENKIYSSITYVAGEIYNCIKSDYPVENDIIITYTKKSPEAPDSSISDDYVSFTETAILSKGENKVITGLGSQYKIISIKIVDSTTPNSFLSISPFNNVDNKYIYTF